MDYLKEQASKYAGGGGNDSNNESSGNNGGSSYDNSSSGGYGSSGSNNQASDSNDSGGGFLSSITNKMNSAAGGGRESEKNEDYLDKGIDYVQEKFLGKGAQDNESAIEQAKDEQISDFIRDKYKTATGSDMPIKDKATTWDKSTD